MRKFSAVFVRLCEKEKMEKTHFKSCEVEKQACVNIKVRVFKCYIVIHFAISAILFNIF